MQMLFIVGGTLAFFFEFLLLSKKNKSIADKLLAVWMLIIGVNLFLIYYYYAGLDFKYTFLLGLGIPFPFLHGPALYLYTAALTGRINNFRPVYLLHFLPFLFFFLYYAPFFGMSSDEKIAFVMNFKNGYSDFYSRYSYSGIMISAISYMVATFLVLRKHEKNLKQYFSYSSEKTNLHWLRNLFIGMSVIWLVVIITNLFFSEFHPDYYIYSTVVLFVISMGYFGVKQSSIFIAPKELMQTIETQNDKNTKEEKEVKRYAKSGLKDEDALEIQKKLSTLMKEKRMYLDETLSLNKLSDELGVLPNYLSQVINEKFGKNFYDFVNSYRVEEFKTLVQRKENRKKTLLALAYDSGFTSKASFNSFFKKLSRQTPSEYVKSLIEPSLHKD